MATITASWSIAPLETTYTYTGYASVDYSVTTTNTSVTVTVERVRIGDYSLINGSVSVSLDGSNVGSWNKINGTTIKTVNESKTVARGHSSSSISISVRISGTIGSSGHTDKNSASNSVPIGVSARPSYAVTYNANGGSSAPSSQTKWHDESLTLTGSKPYRNGYQFWHWNTSSTNSGTTFAPSATYSGNSALNLYAIWNPIITYNANGGSGAPQAQTKPYNASIRLSSAKPQRTGYEFLGWGTSNTSTTASYQPNQTYMLNNTLALYAVWRKVASPPTISSMTVIRCNESGRADDSGEYCKVTASWSVDTTGAGMASNYGTVTGTIVEYGKSTPSEFTLDSGSGGSGVTRDTATAIVPNCDTDKQYVITITVSNNAVGTGQSGYLTTSRNDILTRAFFTLDFAAGGKGIGMGVAAPDEGFECGFDAKFNGLVKVVGELRSPVTVMGTTSDKDEIYTTSSSSPFTIDFISVNRYGYLASMEIRVTPSRDLFSMTVDVFNLKTNFQAVNSVVPTTADFGHISFFVFYGSRLQLNTWDMTFRQDTQYTMKAVYMLATPYKALIG